MTTTNIRLLQIINDLLKKEKVPVFFLIDTNYKILFQEITKNQNFEFYESKLWLKNKLKHLRQCIARTNKRNVLFKFWGPLGLFYSIKPIYDQKQLMGFLIFGGYYVSNVSNKYFSERNKKLNQTIIRAKNYFMDDVNKAIYHINDQINEVTDTPDPMAILLIELLKKDFSIDYSLQLLSNKTGMSEEKINQSIFYTTGLFFKEFYHHLRMDFANQQLRSQVSEATTLAKILSYKSPLTLLQDIDDFCIDEP
ncbi:MAG: hypothetical protein LBV67_02025 [Streptococcaceae bacterium]|jgi:AraC-like DNA-binding protein|nr:hypothetical protein [Streptococcaceae bacterium]